MRKVILAPAIIIALGIAAVLASAVVWSTASLVSSDDSTPVPTDATAVATETPAPDATATAAPASGALPAGTRGRLTYVRGNELITVQLPDNVEVAREQAPYPLSAASSRDGAWAAWTDCGDVVDCDLNIAGPDGEQHTLHIDGFLDGLDWSADGSALAYSVTHYENDLFVRRELIVLERVAIDAPRVVYTSPSEFISPFAWDGADGLIVALNGLGSAQIVRFNRDGSQSDVATAPASVGYFYPSPDRSLFAFTQDTAEGWRLMALDTTTGEISDFGDMGSDPAGVAPPVVSPAAKGPMYVAWSPDSTRLAFGGGIEPPYTMTTVDVRDGSVRRTEFMEGYPGEIEWSPDASMIAVSTYDAERTRHEVYVVDPASGEARHVSSGCVIVWSPDGRFLAQHIDKEHGIAIVDIASGAYGHLTDGPYDVPVWWRE